MCHLQRAILPQKKKIEVWHICHIIFPYWERTVSEHQKVKSVFPSPSAVLSTRKYDCTCLVIKYLSSTFSVPEVVSFSRIGRPLYSSWCRDSSSPTCWHAASPASQSSSHRRCRASVPPRSPPWARASAAAGEGTGRRPRRQPLAPPAEGDGCSSREDGQTKSEISSRMMLLFVTGIL